MRDLLMRVFDLEQNYIIKEKLLQYDQFYECNKSI